MAVGEVKGIGIGDSSRSGAAGVEVGVRPSTRGSQKRRVEVGIRWLGGSGGSGTLRRDQLGVSCCA